jgi:hypothetical protein
MDDLQFIFNNLTPSQRIDFFIYMMETNDVEESLYLTMLTEFTHDELQDIFIQPKNKIIIGNDFVEDGEYIDNYVSIYSNKLSNIDEIVKLMLESGEIIQTVQIRKRYKLGHYRCVKSLNFDEIKPIIPIVYN